MNQVHSNKSRPRWRRLILIPGVVIALTGCAGATPPLDTVSTAEMALTRALSAQAAQYAPLELRLAQEKLDRAKSALHAEEYEDARRQAEQAEVDARLAEAKALSESARQHGEEVEQTMDTLEDEATGR
ncbi:MAG: DUF4398 domain-containing protein [Gammaproteobacteria bacterium]